MVAVADLESGAGLLELARRHRVHGDEEVVQTAGPRQAHLVRGVEQARRLAQQVPRVVGGEELHEPLRTQARPAREHPLEVELAQPHVAGDVAERRLPPVVGR